MSSIRKSLTEILDSKAFDQLDPLIVKGVWGEFNTEEKLLLARLLLMRGDAQLAQGSQKALESFETANAIAAYDPEILFQQAGILSTYRDNIRCLTLASQILAKLLDHSPSMGKGWVLWAHILIDIALFENESSYFNQAEACFEKAFKLSQKGVELPISQDKLFWEWGFCIASLGKLSGEPVDLHRAIDKYKRALELGCQHQEFFNHFGNCLADLGALLEKADYFAEALQMFNRAVRAKPDAFEGWFNQACCLLILSDYDEYEHLLDQAERSFIKAAEIDPDCSRLWWKWGELETSIGKVKRDTEMLHSSFAKFAKAYELESDHPGILNSWAECELGLSVEEHRVDLLHSAQAKILKSLQLESDNPHTWYLYGMCLNEFGCYFGDEDYYNDAIEKFEHGLTLARQNPLLWYGLALAHFALGELTGEQAIYEKAVKYCARVMECGGEAFPQFWNDWGVALLRLGELTEEISCIEAAIDKFEHALKQPVETSSEKDLDLEWIYNYSCAYDLLGDLTEEPQHYEKAIQILTQVLQLDPNYAMARYNLAVALSHLGDVLYEVEPYHKAIEHFQILVESDHENEVVHLDFGMALTNLGLLVYDNYHPEQSEALYRQAEGHFMQAAALGCTQAYYQLAGLYSITGHYDRAMCYLERAKFCGTIPGIEDLLHDDWLEGVRRTVPFRQFIQNLSGRPPVEDL